MNSNTKILILVICAIFFFWINYRYRNLFIRTYNWFSGIPKMAIVFITIIAIVAPALLRNKAVEYFRDFLPVAVNRRLDVVSPKKNEIQQIDSKMEKSGEGIKKRVKTSQVRKVSEQLKKLVASNQSWHCKICNKMLDATYEVDHVISLEDGGDNNINNLRALCRNCHGKKTLRDNITRRYPDGKIY